MRNNEQGELPYPVVCSSLELKHVVGVRGGGGREISSDPGQLWGLSWSGGLHLSAPGGLSLSSFCLSLSVQLDMQELRNPHLPDPGQLCPAMRGHLWEFIPDASCSLRALFSICHSRPSPAQYLHVFAFSLINHLWILFIYLPCSSSNDFFPHFIHYNI